MALRVLCGSPESIKQNGPDPAESITQNGPDPSKENGIPIRRVALLQRLFREQQQYLNNFFENLDYKVLDRVCEVCNNAKGLLLLTGVGKSGYVAQKLAQTFTSIGRKSVFLSPTDALHGDIGLVSEKDILICLSKSGNTEELVKLVPVAKAKGAKIVCVTCAKTSQLADMSDIHVHLLLERELCPFNMAPMTSASLQVIFGDTLAVALMEVSGFTREAYALNHPSGSIGRRLVTTVDNVMLRGERIPTTAPDNTLRNVLVELTSKGCGCLVVVTGGNKLCGIFTDGDLRRLLQRQGDNLLDCKMRDVMTSTPRTCVPDIKAVQALQLMEVEPKVAMLPVVLQDGTVVGLVTLHALVTLGIM